MVKKKIQFCSMYMYFIGLFDYLDNITNINSGITRIKTKLLLGGFILFISIFKDK